MSALQFEPPSVVRLYQVFQPVWLCCRSSCHTTRKSFDVLGGAATDGKALYTAGLETEICTRPVQVTPSVEERVYICSGAPGVAFTWQAIRSFGLGLALSIAMFGVDPAAGRSVPCSIIRGTPMQPLVTYRG